MNIPYQHRQHTLAASCILGSFLIFLPPPAEAAQSVCDGWISPTEVQSKLPDFEARIVRGPYKARRGPIFHSSCYRGFNYSTGTRVKVVAKAGSYYYVQRKSDGDLAWIGEGGIQAVDTTPVSKPTTITSKKVCNGWISPTASENSLADFDATIVRGPYKARRGPILDSSCYRGFNYSTGTRVRVVAKSGTYYYVQRKSDGDLAWIGEGGIEAVKPATQADVPATATKPKPTASSAGKVCNGWISPTASENQLKDFEATIVRGPYKARRGPIMDPSCYRGFNYATGTRVKVVAKSGSYYYVQRESDNDLAWIGQNGIQAVSTKPVAVAVTKKPSTPTTTQPRPSVTTSPPGTLSGGYPGTPQPPQPRPPEGPDCKPDLSCSISYIYDLSLQDRTEWFTTWIVNRYGEQVGFAKKGKDNNWFKNIEAVLSIAPGRFENNKAFNMIDSFILHAVQDGLRRHLGRPALRDPLYSYNLGGQQWHKFFDSLQGGSENQQRRYWGLAEQLATNHGRYVAYTKRWKLDSKTYQLLIKIGDKYRQYVAYPDEAEILIRKISEFCGVSTGTFGLGTASQYACRYEFRKKFNPRTPGLVFPLAAQTIWTNVTIPYSASESKEIIDGSALAEFGQTITYFNGQWNWPCVKSGLKNCGWKLPSGY